MKLLVINADDFGLDPAINAAVAKAHTEGILTSASLMIGARHAAEAIEFARSHPKLGVGLHLCLVDELPIGSPDRLAPLSNSNGQLPTSPLALSLAVTFSKEKAQAVEAEIKAQIERFLATGLKPSHLDTHMHTQLCPAIRKLIAKLAKQYGIPYVRAPYEPFRGRNTAVPGGRGLPTTLGRRIAFATMGKRCLCELRRARLQTADRVVGALNVGQLTESFLASYLQQLPDGLTEIFLHPATETSPQLAQRQPTYRHTEELQALLSPRLRQMIESADIRLPNFRELGQGSEIGRNGKPQFKDQET